MKKRVRARDTGNAPSATRIAIVSQPRDAMPGVDPIPTIKQQYTEGRIISSQNRERRYSHHVQVSSIHPKHESRAEEEDAGSDRSRDHRRTLLRYTKRGAAQPAAQSGWVLPGTRSPVEN